MSAIETSEPESRKKHGEEANDQPLSHQHEKSKRTITKLRREVETLSRTNRTLLEEMEALKDELRTTSEKEGEEHGKLEETKKEHDELKLKRNELEQTVQQLENELAALQSAPDAPSDELGSAKASFRIDLYSREGNGYYIGKIEYLLTKQKKNFAGVDKEAIADFVTAHLPRIEKPSKSTPSTKLSGPMSTTAHPMKLDVMPAEGETPTQNIVHGKPFRVRFALDARALDLEQDAALPYTAQLQAKRLGGSSRLQLGEYTGILALRKTFEVQVAAGAIPPGGYRLLANVTLSSRKGEALPVRLVEESRFINVY